MRDGTYHILHYVGHGDFTASGEGVLFLEGADGGHAELDATELANLVGDQTSLRLVVLNSCEGARTTLTDPFAGVATTLLQLGVPAVVAMQFEISDEAAILFAEELYTNLIGRQAPIDAAVSEARKAIYIEQGTVEWATPVLFMGETDVALFDFHVDAAPLPVEARSPNGARPPADLAAAPATAASPQATHGVGGRGSRGTGHRRGRSPTCWTAVGPEMEEAGAATTTVAGAAASAPAGGATTVSVAGTRSVDGDRRLDRRRRRCGRPRGPARRGASRVHRGRGTVWPGPHLRARLAVGPAGVGVRTTGVRRHRPF